MPARPLGRRLLDRHHSSGTRTSRGRASCRCPPVRDGALSLFDEALRTREVPPEEGLHNELGAGFKVARKSRREL